MFYRKKVVVEAFCWDPSDDSNIPAWARQALFDGVLWRDWGATTPTLRINTLEGEMTAVAGYYIIRGIKGEIYGCEPTIFNETYEEVPECEEVRCESDV